MEQSLNITGLTINNPVYRPDTDICHNVTNHPAGSRHLVQNERTFFSESVNSYMMKYPQFRDFVSRFESCAMKHNDCQDCGLKTICVARFENACGSGHYVLTVPPLYTK